jgi:hypothetical protein
VKVRSVLILIWLAFITRGFFYAAIIPIWEGLDEWAHFAYVHHLLMFGTVPGPDTRVSEEISQSLQLAPIAYSLTLMPAPSVTHDVYWNLPVEERARRKAEFDALSPGGQTKAGREVVYEGKQPPLYYLICAPVLKFAEGTSLATRAFAVRLFTVFLASLLVPLTFSIARRVLGESELAVMASILVAAMPVLSMTGARIANDALAIVLFAILAWALLRPTPWDGRGSLIIGITLGAGFLTKAYFIGCVPVLMVAGGAAIWNAPSGKRSRVAGFVLLSAFAGLAISGWWYLRILGAPGPVWADVSPANSVGFGEMLGYGARMPWWRAVTGSLDMHFWFVGWSFLFVRSWIYLVLRWLFLLLLLGGFLSAFRNRSGLSILWGLYAGFWGAMAYHMFVTFMNQGIPSTTGHYLYAVVACESVILCSGVHQWLPSRWQRQVMASLIGAFLLVEVYATHFVLIPYYAGLIQHRPDTTLQAFYVSQGVELGWTELLLRVAAFKPEFLTPYVFVVIWVAFLGASAGLFALAYRETRVPR